jgi:hypothetical protein
MADYTTITVVRPEPDPAQLLVALRQIDTTIGVVHDAGSFDYRLKKNTSWLAGDVSQATSAIVNVPNATAQSLAQARVDKWPLELEGLLLTLLDQINVIRSKLSPPLSAITPAQALQAVKDKISTL